LQFLRSGSCKFERVDIKCRYTKAKILGTVVCLGGAVAMSVLQSSDAHVLPRPEERAATASWVAGCLFLLGAVLVLSGTIVMQAATMLHFPAPFTLCSVTSLIGAALTAAFQVATAGRLTPGTPQIGLQIVLSLVFVVLPKW
jgi:drug/metabolite transporter (DMT)-like permease